MRQERIEPVILRIKADTSEVETDNLEAGEDEVEDNPSGGEIPPEFNVFGATSSGIMHLNALSVF